MTRRTGILEERTRRRRLTDAARLLPVLGALLFLLPLLWPAPGEAPGTAWGGIYIFLIWGALIAAAAVLSRPLSQRSGEGAKQDGETS